MVEWCRRRRGSEEARLRRSGDVCRLAPSPACFPGGRPTSGHDAAGSVCADFDHVVGRVVEVLAVRLLGDLAASLVFPLDRVPGPAQHVTSTTPTTHLAREFSVSASLKCSSDTSTLCGSGELCAAVSGSDTVSILPRSCRVGRRFSHSLSGARSRLAPKRRRAAATSRIRHRFFFLPSWTMLRLRPAVSCRNQRIRYVSFGMSLSFSGHFASRVAFFRKKWLGRHRRSASRRRCRSRRWWRRGRTSSAAVALLCACDGRGTAAGKDSWL